MASRRERVVSCKYTWRENKNRHCIKNSMPRHYKPAATKHRTIRRVQPSLILAHVMADRHVKADRHLLLEVGMDRFICAEKMH